MDELILATSNKGKINELTAMLTSFNCIVQTQLGIGDVEETGLSFVENALLKARHASSLGHRKALADDSGLVVPALDGAPGIYSARFAGKGASDEHNVALLLDKMSHLHGEQRAAYFYCAIVLVHHKNDPTPLIATGTLHGTIAYTPQGAHGFGYDPVFFVEEYQCTAAQLSPDIKNTISHRAKALMSLKQLVFAHYE